MAPASERAVNPSCRQRGRPPAPPSTNDGRRLQPPFPAAPSRPPSGQLASPSGAGRLRDPHAPRPRSSSPPGPARRGRTGLLREEHIPPEPRAGWRLRLSEAAATGWRAPARAAAAHLTASAAGQSRAEPRRAPLPRVASPRAAAAVEARRAARGGAKRGGARRRPLPLRQAPPSPREGKCATSAPLRRRGCARPAH